MGVDLLTAVGAEFQRLSPRVLLGAFLYAAAEAAFELLGWGGGVTPKLVFWLKLVFLLPFAAAISYVAAMSMIDRAPIVAGFGRFVAGFIGLNLPIIAGSVGILLLPSGPVYEGVRILCLALLALGLLVSTFLPAWPVAQAVSLRPVHPLRLFRATRGRRFGLFLVAVVIGSIDRLVPGLVKATNAVQAFFYAAAAGLAGASSVLAIAAVGVAIWRVSCGADSELCGDVSPGAVERGI